MKHPLVALRFARRSYAATSSSFSLYAVVRRERVTSVSFRHRYHDKNMLHRKMLTRSPRKQPHVAMRCRGTTPSLNRQNQRTSNALTKLEDSFPEARTKSPPSEGVLESPGRCAQRSRHSRRSKHRKAHPKRAVVGKTGANSGKSTIFGGPNAPSVVIIAPEEIDTVESVLPCSIIPGQSIALKTIGRISIFRPPNIVDLPEMKGLLATSTAFLHAKRHKKRAIHLIDRRAQKKMPDAFKQSGICNN